MSERRVLGKAVLDRISKAALEGGPHAAIEQDSFFTETGIVVGREVWDALLPVFERHESEDQMPHDIEAVVVRVARWLAVRNHGKPKRSKR